MKVGLKSDVIFIACILLALVSANVYSKDWNK